MGKSHNFGPNKRDIYINIVLNPYFVNIDHDLMRIEELDNRELMKFVTVPRN